MGLQAQQELKSLFNPEDYPQTIDHKYKIDFRFTPVPQSGHLILDIQRDVLAELQHDIDNQVNEALQANQDEIRDRIEKVIRHAATTLRDPQKKFHNTLLQNIADLADLLPNITIQDSPELDQLTAQLRAYANNNNDADDLREKPLIRKIAADDADEILKTLESIYGA